MTNAELIQKIRAEIERLYDGEAPKHDQQCNFDDGYFVGIDTIAQFLDALESEKPMNPSEHRDPCGLRGPSGVDGDKNWRLLDQEIIDWCGKFRPSIREEIQSTAYHFAYWQKEKMMKDAVKWLVDDDYHEATEKGRFILGSVGIGYNGYYIPYSDLLKLPKED